MPIWKACLATYRGGGRTAKETAQRLPAANSDRATSRQRLVLRPECRVMPERKPTPARVIVRRKTDARDAAVARQTTRWRDRAAMVGAEIKGAANRPLPFLSRPRKGPFPVEYSCEGSVFWM